MPLRRWIFTFLFICAGIAPSFGERYQVRVLSNLSQEHAKQLQRNLQQDGYGPIEVVEKDGKFSVLVGAYPTREMASSALEDLRVSGGYQPEGVASVEEKSEGETVSRAEAGTVYRVLVGEFPNRQLAENIRNVLLADDYAGVELEEEGGKFRVYMGKFATQQDANLLSDQLHRDGYSLAQVQSSREAGSADGASAQGSLITAENVDIPSELREAIQSEGEERTVRSALAASRRIQTGAYTAQDILSLRRDQLQLRDDLRQLVRAVSSVADKEKRQTEAQRKIATLYAEVNEAMQSKQWELAESRLARIREIDPTEPRLEWKAELLERMKNGGQMMASVETQKRNRERATNLLAQARQAESKNDSIIARERYNEVLALDPQNAEARTRLAALNAAAGQPQIPGMAGMGGLTQKQKYIVYGVAAGVVLLIGAFIYLLIQNLRKERELIRQVQELAHSAETHGFAGMAGAGTATALGGNAVDVGLLPESTQSAGRKKTAPGGLSSSPFASSIEMQSSEPAEQPEAQEFPEGEPQVSKEPAEPEEEEHMHTIGGPGEADMVSLPGFDDFEMPPMSPIEPEAPAEEEQPGEEEVVAAIEGGGEAKQKDVVDFADLNIGLPNLDEMPSGLEGINELPQLDTESLMNSGIIQQEPQPVEEPSNVKDITPLKQEPAAEPENAPSEKAPKEREEVAADRELPPITLEGPEFPQAAADNANAPVEAEPVAPAAAFDVTEKLPSAEPQAAPAAEPKPAAAAMNGRYFEQSFDSEPVGSRPKGWEGEYDYANLTVTDSAPVNGSAKCLKFEKRSGAGSANYVCRFEKASGRVTIEFDIRCDEKNKYLLGFYVEKDEDFKQSVHTIVHRTDSKAQPSLRIQGEPIPYDLGSWRHIKYDLNLMAGLVNAYVDGNQIVKDAKLPTNPPYVNTLSIRDNLATTGILYLNNIKIYKS